MIQELKSERVLISLVICVLAAQIPHAHGVWYYASAGTLHFSWAHLFAWLCAWLFAFGLEFSMLMQVIRGRHLLSYLFALISVFINLFYFQIVNDLPILELALRYWVLSVILPLAIACYSHLCASYMHETPMTAQPAVTLHLSAFRLRLRSLRPAWLAWPRPSVVTSVDMSSTAPALGERESAVVEAVRRGASTVYAIAKATNINASTLRRRTSTGVYTGIVEQLIHAGLLAEEDGAIVPAQ